jgi:hypothetical protein
MSKVVLILGAGASIPFIKDGTNKLDTNYLTDFWDRLHFLPRLLGQTPFFAKILSGCL